MTDYLILKRAMTSTRGDDEIWTKVGAVETASATAAIRAYLNGADEGGEFVAVPARSWQPVKVTIEKAVKFGA